MLRLTTGLYYNNHLKVDVNVMLCFKAYYFEKIYTVFFIYPKSSKTGFFVSQKKWVLLILPNIWDQAMYEKGFCRRSPMAQVLY